MPHWFVGDTARFYYVTNWIILLSTSFVILIGVFIGTTDLVVDINGNGHTFSAAIEYLGYHFNREDLKYFFPKYEPSY